MCGHLLAAIVRIADDNIISKTTVVAMDLLLLILTSYRYCLPEEFLLRNYELIIAANFGGILDII